MPEVQQPKKQSNANPLDQVGKFAVKFTTTRPNWSKCQIAWTIPLKLVSYQLRMLEELGVLSPSTLARARDKVRASNSDLAKD